MTIRIGVESDLKNIADLLIASWQQYYTFLPNSFLESLSVHHQINRHRKLMSQGVSYFICEVADSFAGFVSFGAPRSNKRYAEHELYTLYVDDAYHRKGIGSLLLHHVRNIINAESMYVEVMKDNPFREFYVTQGFKKIDIAKMTIDDIVIDNWIYVIDN